MRLAVGMSLLFLATIVGAVELLPVAHSDVAQHVAQAFAMHDPFSPRGPLELHVFSIILFLGLLSGGIALLQKRKLNRTRGL
ncbi:MAG TPA: hypothetical protein VFU08_08550 [Candidatus Udaeobacter sp.]|jgi:hypothetical protein|nr:hypothetical protein [Candidatus Udaeobacter sp.]